MGVRRERLGEARRELEDVARPAVVAGFFAAVVVVFFAVVEAGFFAAVVVVFLAVVAADFFAAEVVGFFAVAADLFAVVAAFLPAAGCCWAAGAIPLSSQPSTSNGIRIDVRSSAKP